MKGLLPSRRITTVFISFVLALCAVPALAIWEVVPSGTTADLYGFGEFVGPWVFGDGGTLLRSTDQGATWSPVATGVGVALHDIFQPSSAEFWIAGDAGTVITTANGGTSWTPHFVPDQSTDLRAIFSRGSGVAYVAGTGGTIFFSDDVGMNWDTQTSGTTADLLAGICPQGGSTNLAVVGGAGGVILRTTDGGTTWAPRTSQTTEDILDFTVSGATVFASCRNGTILRSTDFGDTWEVATSSLQADIHGIATSGQNSAFMTACGTAGRLLKSTNAGVSWFTQASPTGADLYAAAAPSNSLHLAAGAGGIIVRTTDGGGGAVAVPDDTMQPCVLHTRGASPNPFNPRTVIAFTLDAPRPTRIDIHDLAGRHVKTLADGWRAAGEHTVTFAPNELASGTYVYRITAGGEVVTGKVLLLE